MNAPGGKTVTHIMSLIGRSPVMWQLSEVNHKASILNHWPFAPSPQGPPFLWLISMPHLLCCRPWYVLLGHSCCQWESWGTHCIKCQWVVFTLIHFSVLNRPIHVIPWCLDVQTEGLGLKTGPVRYTWYNVGTWGSHCLSVNHDLLSIKRRKEWPSSGESNFGCCNRIS